MKTKFWDIKNVIISLKAIASSIVTSLIISIPMYLGRWFVINDRLMVGRSVQLLTFLFGIVVWGYLSKRWWNWK
jgi:hypothetical protein